MAYEPTEWARGTKITAQKLNNIERGVESVNSEYTPTTWAEGDIVTATKLNNIEQGIVNAGGGGGGVGTEVTITLVNFDTTLYSIGISFVAWNEESNFQYISALYPVGDYYCYESKHFTANAIQKIIMLSPPAMVIPYKEGADFAEGEISVSGNAQLTIDEEYGPSIYISGDCTITFNPM